MHYKVVVIAEAEEDLNRFIQWPVKKIRSSGKKLMRRMIMSDCRISMNFMRKVSWRSLRMRVGIKEFLKYCLMRSEEGVRTGVLQMIWESARFIMTTEIELISIQQKNGVGTIMCHIEEKKIRGCFEMGLIVQTIRRNQTLSQGSL